jgi:hypothetical protein
LFGPDKQTVIKRRGGEVLHCVHAMKTPGGCGRAPAAPIARCARRCRLLPEAGT